MKNLISKLTLIFVVAAMAASGFAQRGGSSGSFGGGRSSFGGGSSKSYSAPSGRSSFTTGGTGSSFGGGRTSSNANTTTKRSSNTSSFTTGGSGNSTTFGGGRPSTATSTTRSNTSTSTSTSTRRTYVSEYRPGYRPSVSINYYGNPYSYLGHSIYWYGGGYYAYYPGGPLMVGTPSMPGYAAAYGYNPGYVSDAPVFLSMVWYIIGGVVMIVVVVAVIRALR